MMKKIAWPLFMIFLLAPMSFSQTPPRGEGELDVYLRIIPFYAVDENGNPVTDLKPNEVEVKIDGKRIQFAHFDRYIFNRPVGQRVVKTEGTEANQEKRFSPETIQSPRHVFLLFDLAFSSHWGFRKSRNLVFELTKNIFETDRVYLLFFGGLKGMWQVWGPVTGREAVRKKLADSLGLWKTIHRPPNPDVQFDMVKQTPGMSVLQDTQSVPGVETREDIPSEIAQLLNESQNFNRWTYQQAAEKLAEAFAHIANVVKSIPGPKLLVYFSQGIRNNIYFAAAYAEIKENPTALDFATTGPFGKDDRLGTSFLVTKFRNALSRLADAGVMTMFINTRGGATSYDEPVGGENSMRHMARTTAGLYTGGLEIESLTKIALNWTTAYYEISFYQKPKSKKGKRHKVEVKIKRPGVKIWTIKRIKDPKGYKYLTDREREVYAVQLIYRGPYGISPRPAGTRFFEFEGKPSGKISMTEREIQYKTKWPVQLRKKKLDVYSVIVEADEHGKMKKLVRVQKIKMRGGSGELLLKEKLPWEGSFVWGIVVVDRKSGLTFWKRWYIPSPLEATQASH